MSAGSEALSFSFLVIVLTCLVIIPTYLFIVGIKLYKANKRNDEQTVERYSHIFEDKRFNNPLAIQYVVVFLLRRFALISLLVFARGQSTIQVIGYLILSFLMLVYIKKVGPFKDPQYNRVELFNEKCVFISGCLIFLQTDAFGNSLEFRYRIGWFQIGTTLLVVVVGVVLMTRANIH